MDGNRKGDDGLVLARIWVGLLGIEVMRLCLLVGPDLCSFGDGEDRGKGGMDVCSITTAAQALE